MGMGVAFFSVLYSLIKVILMNLARRGGHFDSKRNLCDRRYAFFKQLAYLSMVEGELAGKHSW